MKKKIIACFLAFMLALSITACGSNAKAVSTDSSLTDSGASLPETDGSLPAMDGSKPALDGSLPVIRGGGTGGGLDNQEADTSFIRNQTTGIAYANDSKTQTLNIYLPDTGDGPFPVIVALHGGGFAFGSATGNDVSPMLQGVNHGYAVVSVNYRLSGEAVFPAAGNDVKAAVRFIKEHASEYKLDADRMAAWGGSSGGNLASMLGVTGNLDAVGKTSDESASGGSSPDSSVKAVVDWFGPTDFLTMDEQFKELNITPICGAVSSEDSFESKYMGQSIAKDTEWTAKACPVTYIDSLSTDSLPVFMIQQGTADANVPYKQAEEFAEKLKEKLGEDKVGLELIDGASHGSSEFSTDENLTKVFAFLDKTLK